MAATHAKASSTSSTPDQRTFVLDTSVLLSDPRAMLRFDEHEVVLPVVVITELEAKRHHPELGYFARHALRLLDELRIKHGRLDAPLPVGDEGGTLRVELNHSDPETPAGRLPARRQRQPHPRRRACNLAAEGRDVTLVTKDLPMRVKASAVRPGRRRVPRRARRSIRLDRHGRARASRRDDIDAPVRGRARSDLAGGRRPARPHRPGAAVATGARALGRVMPDKRSGWSAATGRRSACAAGPPSSASRWTCCWTDVGIVSLGGRAGTGKSALALCAGLEAVMERRQHKKVVVFRPLYAVGGQELGLPARHARPRRWRPGRRPSSTRSAR